ncbi:SapC family protein [Marinimicrobium sp. ABcell2]|uniref:SapC family protein n=1 Tax=Marinimicrobium sp. ABcell2 TaxID=3069751 RepID=UPI0027B0303D|nr:SapC family protein [Marinimicrobium sp. ABcell2]MDQ2075958.1 SapC family protein [Marinimicrobium sp. ABcell2]
MPQHELLNNIDHKDIRIITERSPEYGDDVWYVPTFWREFRSVQSCYPILFQAEKAEGAFTPVTFFGFQKGENLFLSNDGWDASYVPLTVQRMPFFIGFQNKQEGGEPVQERVITIDMSSPRVSRTEGRELFHEFGGNSEYLETIADILETMHRGIQENPDFIKALVDNDLLEPVTLDIQLKDGSKNQLIGFHTIDEEKFKALPAEVITDLHKTGYLEAIYSAIMSQIQFKELVRRKNLSLPTSA